MTVSPMALCSGLVSASVLPVKAGMGTDLSAGAYYKIGIDKDKLTTIGFNVLYDL